MESVLSFLRPRSMDHSQPWLELRRRAETATSGGVGHQGLIHSPVRKTLSQPEPIAATSRRTLRCHPTSCQMR